MAKVKQNETIKMKFLIIGFLFFFGIIFFVNLVPDKPEVTYTLAIAVLMAFLWISEAIPIGVTSFFPILLFPVLGILGGKDIAGAYINDTIFLFIGGFMMALAMEKWNLHKRIALKVLSIAGGSPFMILLGFMSSTAFLSMWMSNTATTMMMLPIVFSVSTALEEVHGESKINSYLTGLLLSVGYASSVGGVATLVGTPPNLSLQRIFVILYPKGPTISFGQWISFAFPIAVLIFIFVFFLIYLMYKPKHKIKKLDKTFFNDRYKALGEITAEQKRVFILFSSLAILWVFRTNLNFGIFEIHGWSSFFKNPKLLTDGTVAMFIAIILFIVPAPSKQKEGLLTWKITKKIPWGIVFLFGGGFALAKGFVDSGLSNYMGSLLSSAGNLSTTTLVASLTGIMSLLTEFTSNTATTEMILPIMGGLANEIQVNPLLLMIPITLAASMAFMFPIATPPNAIIFSTGKISMFQMMKTGFLINFFAIIIITIITISWGTVVFNIDPHIFPDWAVQTVAQVKP
ncbi:MAG: SLC13/DASS family transporter [Flavobacteriaceae bacterium]|nr:SLC13/DASS family transporter [Flavobacteriaceae bacterium]